ncbi:hypothetical protein ACTXT7_001805 [Hymenolepis weldensis]
MSEENKHLKLREFKEWCVEGGLKFYCLRIGKTDLDALVNAHVCKVGGHEIFVHRRKFSSVGNQPPWLIWVNKRGGKSEVPRTTSTLPKSNPVNISPEDLGNFKLYIESFIN